MTIINLIITKITSLSHKCGKELLLNFLDYQAKLSYPITVVGSYRSLNSSPMLRITSGAATPGFSFISAKLRFVKKLAGKSFYM